MVKRDFINEKSIKLQQLTASSEAALDIVTATIKRLEQTNDEICATVSEIEDYQRRLDEQKVVMSGTRTKNLRIVENFKKLIEA